MITLRRLIECRLEVAEKAAQNAQRTGAAVYAHHSRELAGVLDWLLNAEVDSCEIDRDAARLLASFVKIYAIEFDEFLCERASGIRRSQITEALDRLTEQVPSRAMSAAARPSLGEAG